MKKLLSVLFLFIGCAGCNSGESHESKFYRYADSTSKYTAIYWKTYSQCSVDASDYYCKLVGNEYDSMYPGKRVKEAKERQEQNARWFDTTCYPLKP